MAGASRRAVSFEVWARPDENCQSKMPDSQLVDGMDVVDAVDEMGRVNFQ